MVNLPLEFLSRQFECLWEVRIYFNSILVSGIVLTHDNGTKDVIIVHVSLLMEHFHVGLVLAEQPHRRVYIALHRAPEHLNIIVDDLEAIHAILLNVALE